MKYCQSCGKQLDDEAKFCFSCGSPQAVVQSAPQPKKKASKPEPETQPTEVADPPVSEPTAATEPEAEETQQPKEKKGGNKIVGFRDKTVAFEKKHSLIVNLLVLCCSFVVILVALLAPVKVSFYIGGEDFLKMDGNAAKTDVTCSYVEVDQTIFDMIGALFYVSPDLDDLNELSKEYSQAKQNAQTEYMAWAFSNPTADKYEQQTAAAEILADHLSDMNLLAYALVANYEFTLDDVMGGLNASYDDYDYDGSSGSDNYDPAKDIRLTNYVASIMTMVCGLVIALLAIATAIVSLVFLIKAIIGVCKKKPLVKFNKYMLVMLALSGAALPLMWASPMITVGGGMFAISVFTAVMLFVTSVFTSLVVRGDGWAVVLKNGTVALLTMIAFYLMCGNIFCYGMTQSTYSTSYNVKPGFAFYNMFNSILVDTSSDIVIGASIVGMMLYVFTSGFVMSWTYKAFTRSMRRLVKGESSASPIAMMITALVMMAIIIIGGLMSGTIISAFESVSSSNSEMGDILSKLEPEISWTMRAQVWVAAVLMLAAVIFYFVFKPEKIKKNKSVMSAADGYGSETPAVEGEATDTVAETPNDEAPTTEPAAAPQPDPDDILSQFSE